MLEQQCNTTGIILETTKCVVGFAVNRTRLIIGGSDFDDSNITIWAIRDQKKHALTGSRLKKHVKLIFERYENFQDEFFHYKNEKFKLLRPVVSLATVNYLFDLKIHLNYLVKMPVVDLTTALTAKLLLFDDNSWFEIVLKPVDDMEQQTSYSSQEVLLLSHFQTLERFYRKSSFIFQVLNQFNKSIDLDFKIQTWVRPF